MATHLRRKPTPLSVSNFTFLRRHAVRARTSSPPAPFRLFCCNLASTLLTSTCASLAQHPHLSNVVSPQDSDASLPAPACCTARHAAPPVHQRRRARPRALPAQPGERDGSVSRKYPCKLSGECRHRREIGPRGTGYQGLLVEAVTWFAAQHQGCSVAADGEGGVQRRMLYAYSPPPPPLPAGFIQKNKYSCRRRRCKSGVALHAASGRSSNSSREPATLYDVGMHVRGRQCGSAGEV